jgi:hypothetical protein
MMQKHLHSKSLYDIFSDLHGKDSKSQICNIDCKSQVQGEPFQVEGGLTVGDVASFGTKYIIFTCVEDQVDICIEQARKAAHAQAANISWREKKPCLPACH